MEYNALVADHASHDLAIVYRSGRARYARLDASLTFTTSPPERAVGRQCGLAVPEGTRPEAMLPALTILSLQGQKILEANGFKPIGSLEGD